MNDLSVIGFVFSVFVIVISVIICKKVLEEKE
jgi:hypothetical protein